MMQDAAADPLAETRRVNAEATHYPLSQSADAGVEHFIFLSSVKAVGEGRPFAYVETGPCQPQDPCGVSKMEAEEVVREFGREHSTETVILRPTVVYCPHVRANILRLMNLDYRGVPLPLDAVWNQHGIVHVGNFVSAIPMSLQHPKAAGETFFVVDELSISTRELVESFARHMDNRALAVGAGDHAPRSGDSHRQDRRGDWLIGSLAVDTFRSQSTLAWTPTHPTEHGLLVTAEWFLESAAGAAKRGEATS